MNRVVYVPPREHEVPSLCSLSLPALFDHHSSRRFGRTAPKEGSERDRAGLKLMPTHEQKLAFLREDLLDTLKWLFVGAIAWDAASKRDSYPFDTEKRPCSPHLIVMAMYTTLTLCRSLYEFFSGNPGGDNARAVDFAAGWNPSIHSTLYSNYMAKHKAINKRISHLVYNRASHSGGTGHEGPDQLNQQVLPCAKDILDLTREFVRLIDSADLRAAAQSSLEGAVAEANSIAKAYGVTNPFF
jgi:hypothetical protein